MKKLARIACLVTALMLSGFAAADAAFIGVCNNSCGDWFFTDYRSCCNSQYQCSDGSVGYGLSWHYNGETFSCLAIEPSEPGGEGVAVTLPPIDFNIWLARREA